MQEFVVGVLDPPSCYGAWLTCCQEQMVKLLHFMMVSQTLLFQVQLQQCCYFIMVCWLRPSVSFEVTFYPQGFPLQLIDPSFSS